MDHDRFARVEIDTEGALWTWLSEHHNQPDTVWLVTWKKHHPARYVSRDAVLDALIAFGWIDGRRLKLDADRTMQLISPRQQQVWAQSYKTRAARLEADGRMQAAGRAALLRGQSSGLWHVSDPVDALLDPDDLLVALEQAGAGAWWRSAAPSYRRNILRWIAQSKRPDTRMKRLATVASHAARGQKVPQY